MRDNPDFQGAMFSYISLQERVPAAHPLRKLRAVVDALLAQAAELAIRHKTESVAAELIELAGDSGTYKRAPVGTEAAAFG